MINYLTPANVCLLKAYTKNGSDGKLVEVIICRKGYSCQTETYPYP